VTASPRIRIILSFLREVVGVYEDSYDGRTCYASWSPALLAYRIRHKISGPERGCSCSTCFDSPRRRVAGSQIIEANVRIAELRAALQRAVRLAEGMHQMIDQDTWRSHGADWQGQYEGDHHADQIREELRALKARSHVR
jgi:hypothetical protein